MPSSSSPSSAADSYIGSVISLTSKFEIRYEGVLCSLNPLDSTLGLKNVVSFGTEGRKKDGQQIPASDKVYEYILFRGSDIKDLQVKSSPSPVEESVDRDPAIIESKFATGNSVPVNRAVVESSPYEQESVVKSYSFSSLPPQHGYGPQAGAWASTTAQTGDFSSNTISDDWPSHNSFAGPRAMTSNAAQLSPITSFPVTSSFQASTENSQMKFSNSLAPMPPLAFSNSLNPYDMPPVTPGQLSSQPPYGMSGSLPAYPPVVSDHQLNMGGFPSAGVNGAKFESVNFNENIPYQAVAQPSHSLSYDGSSVMDSVTGGYLKQSSSLITPKQLSQPRQSEFPTVPTFGPDDRKMATINSTTSFSSSSMPPMAAQGPVPPFHPSTQQFTEEFDFEAMNQKFNKDEVWGQLGSAKLNDKGARIDNNDTIGQTKVNCDSGGLMPAADSQSAYKKDDFFDTISCNSSTSHRGRDRQNHYSDRTRFDSRNYEDFQQQRFRPQFGGYGGGRGPQFGDYGGGRGTYPPRGSYGWGRGYNSGGRGRGGNVQW